MTAASIVSKHRHHPSMDRSREEVERQAAKDASDRAKQRLIASIRLTIRTGDFSDIAEALDLPYEVTA